MTTHETASEVIADLYHRYVSGPPKATFDEALMVPYCHQATDDAAEIIYDFVIVNKLETHSDDLIADAAAWLHSANSITIANLLTEILETF